MTCCKALVRISIRSMPPALQTPSPVLRSREHPASFPQPYAVPGSGIVNIGVLVVRHAILSRDLKGNEHENKFPKFNSIFVSC